MLTLRLCALDWNNKKKSKKTKKNKDQILMNEI
jgi:hypothetical protein